MKARFWLLAVAAALVLGLLALPVHAADKKGDGMNMEKLKAETKAEYLEWEAKTEAFLTKSKATAKEQYKQFLADLERAKAEARESYGEAKDSGGEAWEKAKDKYDKAMAKLKAAYDAAAEKLKE